MMDDDYIISVQGLTKSYGEKKAIDGLDMKVRRGEMYAFL